MVGAKGLIGVAQRLSGNRVHLDHEAIGPHRGGRQRERDHEFPPASCVRRIHDDGQVREFLEDGHGRNVQRGASRHLERPDASLTQNDLVVSAGEDVFGSL